MVEQKGFRGNPNLKRKGHAIEWTSEMIEEYIDETGDIILENFNFELNECKLGSNTLSSCMLHVETYLIGLFTIENICVMNMPSIKYFKICLC